MSEQDEAIVIFEILSKKIKEQGYTQDITTPGFITEYAAAQILGHELHKTKHGPDACDKNNPEITYEYLSAKIGRNPFQIDRIDETNIDRVKRNAAFYMIIKNGGPTDIEEIYRVETKDVLGKVLKSIEGMKTSSRHINIYQQWVKDNGKLVYTKSNDLTNIPVNWFIGSREL